jgi:Zn ribbon nucleic-acid-binding protein
MLSFINMKCPACESVYTLSVEELNIVLLFKCYECGQHNVYVAGNVLALDQEKMTEGTDEEKKKHIVETVQLFACEFAGNVFGNIDRIINVNVEVDLEKQGRRKKRRVKRKSMQRKEISGTQEIHGSRPLPSVTCKNAPEITEEEVRDFVKIDLNLIDKKSHFDRFFSGKNN